MTNTNLHHTPLDLQCLQDKSGPPGTNIHGAWIHWLWNLGDKNTLVHMVQLETSYCIHYRRNQERSPDSHRLIVHLCCCGMCLGDTELVLAFLGHSSDQLNKGRFLDTLVMLWGWRCQLFLRRTILLCTGPWELFGHNPITERLYWLFCT